MNTLVSVLFGVWILAGIAGWITMLVVLTGSAFKRFRLLNGLIVALAMYGAVSFTLGSGIAYADREHRFDPPGEWTNRQWNQSFTVAACGNWLPYSAVGIMIATLLCVPGGIVVEREERRKAPAPHNYQI